MPLVVYTSTVAYDGPDRLDVSRKGNDPLGFVFAPSQSLFRRYLTLRELGRWNHEAALNHEAMFKIEMDESFVVKEWAWRALFSKEMVTLCCHCRDNPSACHRVWLAKALVGRGAVYEGER